MSLFFAIAAALLMAAGVAAPWFVLVGAVAIGNLAALLPLSVAGLGAREGAILAVLAAAGYAAPAGAVASYALAFHAVFTLTPWMLTAASASRVGLPRLRASAS